MEGGSHETLCLSSQVGLGGGGGGGGEEGREGRGGKGGKGGERGDEGRRGGREESNTTLHQVFFSLVPMVTNTVEVVLDGL